MMKKSGTHFGLTVNGESMIELGIYHGDLAVVGSQSTAQEIVAAIIDGEATLKTYSPHKTLLLPANPDFSPIVVTNESFNLWYPNRYFKDILEYLRELLSQIENDKIDHFFDDRKNITYRINSKGENLVIDETKDNWVAIPDDENLTNFMIKILGAIVHKVNFVIIDKNEINKISFLSFHKPTSPPTLKAPNHLQY